MDSDWLAGLICGLVLGEVLRMLMRRSDKKHGAAQAERKEP